MATASAHSLAVRSHFSVARSTMLWAHRTGHLRLVSNQLHLHSLTAVVADFGSPDTLVSRVDTRVRSDWVRRDRRAQLRGIEALVDRRMVTAIVTALTTTRGKFSGQVFTTQERATDIFVKQNERWQCALSQLIKLTKKPLG
jgi:hypothetical protein